MTAAAGAAASLPLPRGGVRRQRWRDRAACRHADPDLFFPELGGDGAEGKAICAGCPVTAECLRHAVGYPERHGTWGGLSERERYGMRSQRGEAA